MHIIQVKPALYHLVNRLGLRHTETMRLFDLLLLKTDLHWKTQFQSFDWFSGHSI